MKEPVNVFTLRQPTLSVIDENGINITDNTDNIDCGHIQLPKQLSPLFPRKDIHENNRCVRLNLSPEFERGSDLDNLKQTTTRLKLSARRPSIVAWKTEHLERPNLVMRPDLHTNGVADIGEKEDKLTDERKDRINQALAWLRQELVSILL
jgi:hypothetical protein